MTIFRVQRKEGKGNFLLILDNCFYFHFTFELFRLWKIETI